MSRYRFEKGLLVVVMVVFAVVGQAEVWGATIEDFESYTTPKAFTDGEALQAGFEIQRDTVGTTAVTVGGDSSNQFGLFDINAGVASYYAFAQDAAVSNVSGLSYYRSVDLRIERQANGRGVLVALLDGDLDTSSGIANINPSEVLGLEFSGDNKKIHVRRRTPAGALRSWTAAEGWSTTANNTIAGYWSLDTDYKAIISVASGVVSFTLESGATTIFSGTSNLSDTTSVDTIRYVAGEPMTNAGDWAKFRLDNLDTVPEPATMVLLGLGGVGLLIRRRRRS